MLEKNKEKKKILICVDWFAPGYKAGGPIQSCVNFVKAMESVYDIYVLTTDTDFGAHIHYTAIESNRWLPFEDKAQVCYLSKDNLHYKSIKQKIKEIAPDFIYLNSMFSYRFTLQPLIYSKLHPTTSKMVLSPRGMLHSGALQYKRSKKEIYLFLLKFLINKDLIFHATDEQEKNDIKRYYSNTFHVIENVPDFPSEEEGSLHPIQKQPNKLKLIFISRVSPKKNLDYLLNIFNHLGGIYQIELLVIGEVDSETYRQKLEKLIKDLPSNIIVTLKGAIPHNEIYKQLRQHHFFILPTFGENFGHAIFEALVAGRPVIISDQTPWRDLAAKQAGFDLSLQKEENWIHTIEQAAQMTQTEYDRWAMGAWYFAKRYLEDSNVKEKYQALFS